MEFLTQWYRLRIEWLLKGAKSTRYVGFDVDYDKIKSGDLLMSAWSDSNWNDALKITLSKLLP